MNIISCYQLLLMLTYAIHFSEQIKYINESSSIDVCKGKDVNFLFKVDEEENKINTLEWYFNNKVICTSYSHDDFTVKPLYQGRIKQINKTGIQLKNVSIDDEGIYMLLPLNPWSATEIRVEIKLHVLEPPTNKCTCNAGRRQDFTSEQAESIYGRPQVSCVWKSKQTLEVLGEGNQILNSTLQDEEVLCCQNGKALKCVDNNEQFCTTAMFPQQDNTRPPEDGNAQHTDSTKLPGTDAEPINTHNVYFLIVSNFIFGILTIVLVLLIIIYLIRKERKDRGLTISLLSFAKILHRIMIFFHCISSSDDRVSGQHPPKRNDPRLETNEANTVLLVLLPRNDSKANSEV